MKKGIKTTICATAATLVVFTALLTTSCGNRTAVNYRTAPISRRDIARTVTGTGTIEPVNQVEVGTQVSGIIDKIYVDYNSVVTKGQLLAEMDKTTLQSELESSNALLRSAEVEFNYQKKNYERYKELFEKGLISQTDYEQEEYQYQTAQQSLARQRSEIAKSRRNLEYATITSPIDGVVLSRAVEEGQTVASGFSTPTLFTIAADLTKMQVVADIDEADIGDVEEGQRVMFTVDAFRDRTFEGSVTQVRLEATTTSNVVTYEVVIEAPNPDLILKPGLTANITIYTLEKNGVLAVPSKALRFTPDSADEVAQSAANSGTLWLQLPDGTLKPVTVTTGDKDEIYIEVSGAINEGDLVVTGIDTSAPAKSQKQSKSLFNSMRPGHPGGDDDKQKPDSTETE